MRKIKITFDVVTPESAEDGDTAERGWIDEEGESMEPDEYDVEDGVSAVDKASAFLSSKGAAEPSSAPFCAGTWYTNTGDADFGTGDVESRSYHLDGFSEDEEREIYRLVTGRK